MNNDFARTGYERGRLLRAGAYIEKGRAKLLGPGEVEILSTNNKHRYVNLNSDLPCDCEDQDFRGVPIRGQCKHVLCARMLNGDVALLTAWGIELMRRAERVEAANV